jgi:hypothetical protein
LLLAVHGGGGEPELGGEGREAGKAGICRKINHDEELLQTGRAGQRQFRKRTLPTIYVCLKHIGRNLENTIGRNQEANSATDFLIGKYARKRWKRKQKMVLFLLAQRWGRSFKVGVEM